MAWYLFVVAIAVLLIAVYGIVRLRRHETDPIAGGDAGPGPRSSE
jgi:hypothetical protein